MVATSVKIVVIRVRSMILGGGPGIGEICFQCEVHSKEQGGMVSNLDP